MLTFRGKCSMYVVKISQPGVEIEIVGICGPPIFRS